MDQALPALRLGFLSRELRAIQERVWSQHPFQPPTPDVTPCLRQIDSQLNCLSDRINNYQRETVTALLRKLDDGHDTTCGYACSAAFAAFKEQPDLYDRLLDIVVQDEGTKLLRESQQTHWTDLRNLLQGVIGIDARLAAWFEIGDHLADVLFQVAEDKRSWQLTGRDLQYLYSGVLRLQSPENWAVHDSFVRWSGGRELPFFHRATGRMHMVVRLRSHYECLCWLLGKGDIREIPRWDGETLTYRQGRKQLKRQRNGVIEHILDAFERLRWPESVPLPTQISQDADAQQAISYFNKESPIHLRYRPGRIFWGGRPLPRSAGGRRSGRTRSGLEKSEFRPSS